MFLISIQKKHWTIENKMTIYVSLYKNLDTLSEYDRKFAEQRREAVLKYGYVPLKRFQIDPETTSIQTERWIQQDRRHFAKWRLSRQQKEAAVKKNTELCIRKRRHEYVAYLINIEYQALETSFWAEAPKMLPYQRKHWFAGRWPEYYWTHTALKAEIAELKSDPKSDELLWAELPLMVT